VTTDNTDDEHDKGASLNDCNDHWKYKYGLCRNVNWSRKHFPVIFPAFLLWMLESQTTIKQTNQICIPLLSDHHSQERETVRLLLLTFLTPKIYVFPFQCLYSVDVIAECHNYTICNDWLCCHLSFVNCCSPVLKKCVNDWETLLKDIHK
jgi:hypothetical protein